MKVLHILTRLNIGGPARHVVTLGSGLAARGIDTLLVHGHLDDTEGSFEHLPRDRGLRSLCLAELGRSVRWTQDATAFVKLVRIMIAEQPDVVHTHTAKAGALGRLAASVYNVVRRRRRRCCIVHTFHGHVFVGYFRPLHTWLARLTERGLSLLTDRIVALSGAQARDLVRRYHVAAESQVTIVPLGLELGPLLKLPIERRQGARRFGFADSDVVIGYVGRFVPIKDPENLVRAFAILAATVPSVKLLLVGDGELRESLRALAESLGVGGSTVFTGWREDLAEIYEAIDIVTTTSLNDGTPVALLEGMAAGRAIVATSVGGVPDVVRDGVTGLLIPAADPGRAASAFERLVRDGALRRRMGACGRRRAVTEFEESRLVSNMARLYETALEVKRGDRASCGRPRVAAAGQASGIGRPPG